MDWDDAKQACAAIGAGIGTVIGFQRLFRFRQRDREMTTGVASAIMERLNDLHAMATEQNQLYGEMRRDVHKIDMRVRVIEREFRGGSQGQSTASGTD